VNALILSWMHFANFGSMTVVNDNTDEPWKLLMMTTHPCSSRTGLAAPRVLGREKRSRIISYCFARSINRIGLQCDAPRSES
jgi:hypothetical protein